MDRINSAKNDPKKTWKITNEQSARKVHKFASVKCISGKILRKNLILLKNSHNIDG